MAFTDFTIEGDAILGYFSDQVDDRHVRIKDDNENEESIGERVEQLIARSLNFPNDAEFDQHFERMAALREQDLQPADGQPDLVREGIRLRITVSVVEDGE